VPGRGHQRRLLVAASVLAVFGGLAYAALAGPFDASGTDIRLAGIAVNDLIHQ